MKLKPKNFNLKAVQGFTLIELLIVIAILTVLFAITIVAVNPVRQFSQANNTQRRSDINALINGIYQYAADNRGTLPVFIPTTSTQMFSDSATTGCSATCGSTTTVDSCLPIESKLVPTYLASIPYDPLQDNASTTYYAATRSATGNRVTITACSAEIDETISFTR